MTAHHDARKSSRRIASLAMLAVLVTGCGKAAAPAEEVASVTAEPREVAAPAEAPAGASAEQKDNAAEDTSSSSLIPIAYTFQNHPCVMMDGEQQLIQGNYYTLKLDQSDRETWPRLQALFDAYGEQAQKGITEFMTKSEPEVREMFSTGWGIGYEEDHTIFPVRSDSRVVSFYESIYVYLAGAHGYASYDSYNYDPSTGKDILFTDVVKDTEALPEVIFEELIKQNEDLEDYFGEDDPDKQSLLESIPERLKDNARGLSWTLGYDGIGICFEDYAMGSYVAGSREVYIRFADHPDLFTGAYQDYADAEKLPDIREIAKELKEAERTEVAPSLSATE